MTQARWAPAEMPPIEREVGVTFSAAAFSRTYLLVRALPMDGRGWYGPRVEQPTRLGRWYRKGALGTDRVSNMCFESGEESFIPGHNL